MAKQEVTKFEDNEFVLHFSGDRKSINAITLGNALVSFSKAFHSICHEIDPQLDVEITVEAVGHGSFRVLLKLNPIILKHILGNALEEISYDIIVQIFVAFLKIVASEYTEINRHDGIVTIESRVERTIDTDGRVTEREEKGISIPASIYEKLEKARINSNLNRHVSQAIKTIQADSNIGKIGICRGLHDRESILNISKYDFSTIVKNTEPQLDAPIFYEDVLLTVRVPVLENSKRQWEFYWGQSRILAIVHDDEFRRKLSSGEIAVRMGDQYRVDLLEYRSRDKKIVKYTATNLRSLGDRR